MGDKVALQEWLISSQPFDQKISNQGVACQWNKSKSYSGSWHQSEAAEIKMINITMQSVS